MKFLRKAAALILAAVISVTSVGATAFAYEPETAVSKAASQKLGSTTLTVKAAKTGYSFAWKEVSGAEGYVISYSTDGGKNYFALVTVGSGISGITVTTLDPSLAYSFRIRALAYDTSGSAYYGSYSPAVTTKAITASTAKPAKTTLTAKVSDSYITLSWTAVPSVSKYLIYLRILSVPTSHLRA